MIDLLNHEINPDVYYFFQCHLCEKKYSHKVITLTQCNELRKSIYFNYRST